MKRIVVTCCILSASFTLANAQSVVNPASSQEQQVAPKLLFSSKINEFSAYTGRNSPYYAQKAYDAAEVMMQSHIAENSKKLGATAEVVVNEKAIYAAIKPLASDIMKNKAAITQKLKEFMQTM